MSKEDFQNEKRYQLTMHLVKDLLDQGIITKEEYCQIDTIFTEKYAPIIGKLLYDVSLT